MHRLSDADLREYAKSKLRVLSLPFEAVLSDGDYYLFVKNGRVFSKVDRNIFSRKQKTFFDSIKETSSEN